MNDSDKLNLLNFAHYLSNDTILKDFSQLFQQSDTNQNIDFGSQDSTDSTVTVTGISNGTNINSAP